MVDSTTPNPGLVKKVIRASCIAYTVTATGPVLTWQLTPAREQSMLMTATDCQHRGTCMQLARGTRVTCLQQPDCYVG